MIWRISFNSLPASLHISKHKNLKSSVSKMVQIYNKKDNILLYYYR